MQTAHLRATPWTGTYPPFPATVPPGHLTDGPYRAHFATSPAALDAALGLRYEVFNLELGEGLDSAHARRRDLDEFDSQCHHLLVAETATGRVIGTYRMQTPEMAAAGRGFYSATEFDLSSVPAAVRENAVELGRACVHKDYRNSHVLMLLWRGLGRYLAHNQLRYFFGCCSLTSQDPVEGAALRRYLEANQFTHPTLRVAAWPAFRCAAACDGVAPPPLPKLMKIYLLYGAKICSEPALDRTFKTIDYLTLMDVHELSQKTYAYFFKTRWEEP